MAGIPFLETAVTAVLLDGLTGSRDRGRLFLYAILGAGLILALSLWRNYEDCRIETGYQRLFASHEIGLTGKAYTLPLQQPLRRRRGPVLPAAQAAGHGEPAGGALRLGGQLAPSAAAHQPHRSRAHGEAGPLAVYNFTAFRTQVAQSPHLFSHWSSSPLYDAQSYHDTLPVRIFPEEIVTNPGNLPIRAGAADAGAIHIGQTVTMAAQKELAGMGEKSYNEGDKYCGGMERR